MAQKLMQDIAYVWGWTVFYARLMRAAHKRS